MAKGQYSRKSATRDERKKILIVCEGEKTEPNYFRSFRYPKDVVEVSVDGAGCETIRVVERAIERRDKANNSKNPYDEIWCVFDRDSFPKAHFYNALAMARKQSFRLAYSIEAFELWYLLLQTKLVMLYAMPTGCLNFSRNSIRRRNMIAIQ